MCDPISIGIASAVGSIASTAGSYMIQQRQMESQNRANEAWRSYQKQQRDAENQRQEALRQKAEAARAEGVDALAPKNQQDAQAAEEARLTEDYSANTSVNEDAGSKLLSGQQLGGQEFQTDVAKRLNTASQDARKRIAALATVQSYGGSFGGLQNRNAEVLAKSDQGINLANNMRQGSLSAYNLAKGVNPPQYGPATDPFGGVAGTLAGIAGKSFGTAFAPTVKA